MNRLIILGLVISVVVLKTRALNQDSWYGVLEPSCIYQGGLCIVQSQCLEPMGRPGELCSQQAAQGFQCCLGLPKDEKRCRKHGGQCYEKGYCRPAVVYSEASDCRDNQDCCILV